MLLQFSPFFGTSVVFEFGADFVVTLHPQRIIINHILYYSSLFLCLLFEIVFLWQALHHPFTAPNPEDMKDLSSARALAYDMVYNGVEVLNLVCFIVSMASKL